jgi:hypothetical protein
MIDRRAEVDGGLMSRMEPEPAEAGLRPAPTDSRQRDRVVAELRRRQELAATPELAASWARLADRAQHAAEVWASPESPWIADGPEEADRRWAAMRAESERVRRGLAEGLLPEELGLRSMGEAVAELLQRRTAAG